MVARIIDGAAMASEVRAEIAARVQAHVEAGGARPKLVAVLVGDDPGSQSYVASKTRGCAEAGMDSTPSDCPQTPRTSACWPRCGASTPTPP